MIMDARIKSMTELLGEKNDQRFILEWSFLLHLLRPITVSHQSITSV